MSTSPPPRNRRWIWFFVVVFVLTAVATIIGRISIARQQLKPEQLAAAEARWQAKGPRDYHLTYTIAKLNSADERYVVEVRGGKAVAAAVDGRPEDIERLRYYGMTSLYDYIQGFLDEDAKPDSPGAFVTADFGETDGRLRNYRRSVRSRRERVEIKDVKVEPVKD
jgi:hypothetical protein